MHQTFTPDSLISHLYHSNEEIPEAFLETVFSDEFLMDSFVKEAEKLYPFAHVSTVSIRNIEQFASSCKVPGFPDSSMPVFMS
jgi:hypothetical protein